jgi:hypothetical protein
MWMKSVSIPALVALGLLATAQTTIGQEIDEAELEELERYVELARSDLKKDRIRLVGEAMDFSAEEAAAFWPIYKDYEEEFSELGDERLILIGDYAAHYWEMTDDKAKELTSRALAFEEQRTALKRKYVERVATAISPVVAARFLQVEGQINTLLDLQISQQLPLIE